MREKIIGAILIIIIYNVTTAFGQLDEGESCELRNGAEGKCVNANECLEEFRNPGNRRNSPIVCSFKGFNAVICCSLTGQDTNSPITTFNSGITNQRIKKRKRINELKCDEYSASVEFRSELLPLLPDETSIPIVKSTCKFENTLLIVGGKEANIGEFPHMAAVGWSEGDVYDFKCGGSLISEWFVLSAAHCVFTRELPVIVRLGSHNIYEYNPNQQDRLIEQIIVHDNYTPSSKYFDILLLKLSEKVRFNNFVRPACLWNDYFPIRGVLATGWGATETKTYTKSNVLRWTNLEVMDQFECMKRFGKPKHIKNGIVEHQICAINKEGGKDTCQGDSGGPLQFVKNENNCIFYIAGLTSFGKVCGEKGEPGIYTRVSSFIDWIEDVVWKDEK